MSRPGPRRLLLPLLAALAVHGLGLSWAQLQDAKQRRRPPLSPPTSRDNTPELLRFSRQAALGPALATVALPRTAALPPPPDGSAPAGRAVPRSAGSRERQPPPTSSSPGKPARGKPPLARPAARGSGNAAGATAATPPSGPLRSGGSSAGGSSASSSAGGTTAGGNAAGNGPPPRQEESSAVLSLLKQLGRQQEPASGSATAPPPPALEGAAAAAYRRLWHEATVARPASPALAGLPATVESRRAGRSLVQRLRLNPGHRQAVLLDRQVLLFWQEGETLWLLRLPGEQAGSPG